MIHPIPSGTRDVLPDETREVRAITDALRGVFERHGYGEVYTPALEYEAVLARADMAEAQPTYRVFDESGAVLVLRSDMTVPIARVVATRYTTTEPPLRFCYFAHCYRGVRPQRGQPRELLQAGIELIGAPAPQGTAEALTVLCRALDITGLKDYRVGLGDASLFPALMASLNVPPPARRELLDTLARRDFVDLERRLAELGLGAEASALLLSVPQRRGGPEVLSGAPGPVADAVAGMRMVHELLDAEVAARVIFDLGLVRDIGYYTGAVFEVYDPALGAPLGGGGRYDELLGRFGRSLPAVGFALGVDRLHIALAGEERGTGALAAQSQALHGEESLTVNPLDGVLGSGSPASTASLPAEERSS
jgi:ATP phosphoribosyltransferase regulatory subunit